MYYDNTIIHLHLAVLYWLLLEVTPSLYIYICLRGPANQESNIGGPGDFDLIEVYALYSKLSIGSNSYRNHSLLVCFSQIMLMLNISKLYNRFALTLRICQSPILSISVQFKSWLTCYWQFIILSPFINWTQTVL